MSTESRPSGQPAGIQSTEVDHGPNGRTIVKRDPTGRDPVFHLNHVPHIEKREPIVAQ